MYNDRRAFLKNTGIVGGALLTGIAAARSTPTAAQTGPSAGGGALPQGMTFCTLRRDSGFGLGVKTPSGILEVVAAEESFKQSAPTTITAVLAGEGKADAIKGLIEKAQAAGGER